MATDVVRPRLVGGSFGTADAVDTNLIQGIARNTRYISFNLSNIFVATLELQTSNDNVNWTKQEVVLSDGSTKSMVDSITATGFYEVNLKGLYYRLRTVAYTSGTVDAAVFLYQDPIPMAVGGGDASAANQLEQIANFGDITDTPATDNTGNFTFLSFLKRLLNVVLAKGIQAAANSISVVLASDQGAITTQKDTVTETLENLTTVTPGTSISVDGKEAVSFDIVLTAVGNFVTFAIQGSKDGTNWRNIGEEFTWFSNQDEIFHFDDVPLQNVRVNLLAINGGTPNLAVQISHY